MAKVIIKDVNRKTTISKAVISKAAKVAYRSAIAGRLVKPKANRTNKSPKAA
jgi:hypothetical protein